MSDLKISDDYDLVDEWLDWNRARTDPESYVVDSLSLHCLRTLVIEQIRMSVFQAVPEGYKLVLGDPDHA